MEEIKKVNATISIDAYCECPYCGRLQDVFYIVRELLDEELCATDCGIDIVCEKCRKMFEIQDVTY